MTLSVKGWLTSSYLALCLLLGGASGWGAGAIGNGLLQVAAIILIIGAVWTWRPATLPASAAALLLIAGLFVAFNLLYLVPLPHEVWSQLPQRAPIASGLEMLGLAEPALPASLEPQGSIASLMWFLPPAAAFILAIQLLPAERKMLAFVVIGIAILSVFLGAAQLMGGTDSSLRFYQITNPTRAVGFFANANHQATLLVCSLPLAAVIAGQAAQRRNELKRGAAVAISLFIGFFIIAGIVSVESLAGYGLGVLAAVAAFLIYRRAARGWLGTKWLLAGAAVGLVVVSLALLGPLREQDSSGALAAKQTSRDVMARTTVEAALDFFPVGSGLGSFVAVYRTYQDPDEVYSEFVNHAHNDYLELALETGLVGIAVVLAFLIWWLTRSFTVWRSEGPGENLARAGSVIVAMILLHSLVDYPIRTSAIAVLFALGCAFLIPPPAEGEKPRRRSGTRSAPSGRHLEAD